MAPRLVAFVDLDDTLFHSTALDGAEVVARSADGSPGGFMEPQRRAFFEWLRSAGAVVPTTGRNTTAYRRVELGFEDWAICSFGGVLLEPGGGVCRSWRDRVAPLAGPVADTLAALPPLCAEPGVRSRVIEDDGMPLYLSVKTERGAEAPLTGIGARLREAAPGWWLHHNGHNLALFPPWLGKEHAVRWLRAEVFGPEAWAVGVGDSLSDAPFLAACDWAITPAGSQILRTLLPGGSGR
jgi:hypothetical protein